MIAIEMTIADGTWGDEAALRGLAERAIGKAAEYLPNRLPDDAEISLLFTCDEQIQALNAQWRGKDKPTNVLSFAISDAGGPNVPLLGDIVLSRKTIAREAQEQDKTFDDHTSHMLVHGLLHLAGYNHETDAEAEHMETLEREICASLGIADPYAEH